MALLLHNFQANYLSDKKIDLLFKLWRVFGYFWIVRRVNVMSSCGYSGWTPVWTGDFIHPLKSILIPVLNLAHSHPKQLTLHSIRFLQALGIKPCLSYRNCRKLVDERSSSILFADAAHIDIFYLMQRHSFLSGHCIQYVLINCN